MPMMTSTCKLCGNPKETGEYLNDYCHNCFAAQEGAAADAVANGKDPLEAKRRVRETLAHNAHRKFVDPRTMDRRDIWANGNRPAPAEGA